MTYEIKLEEGGGTRFCFVVKNIRYIYTPVWKSWFSDRQVCSYWESILNCVLFNRNDNTSFTHNISPPAPQKINPEFTIGFDRLVIFFIVCMYVLIVVFDLSVLHFVGCLC